MILHVNYEELTALKAGARALLGGDPGCEFVAAAASPLRQARVRAVLSALEPGSVSVTTVAALRDLAEGVGAIVECLRAAMEASVVATHPAGEEAVAAYFDFAHALAVSNRLEEMEEEMLAVIEVVTGSPADGDAIRTFRFPD